MKNNLKFLISNYSTILGTWELMNFKLNLTQMRNNFINVVSFTPKGKGHFSLLVTSSVGPSLATSSEGWEKSENRTKLCALRMKEKKISEK